MAANIASRTEGDVITVSINHSLDKNQYSTPLTIKTYVGADWEDTSVTQANKSLAFKTLTDAEGKYVLYQAVPNAGDITLSRK